MKRIYIFEQDNLQVMSYIRYTGDRCYDIVENPADQRGTTHTLLALTLEEVEFLRDALNDAIDLHEAAS